MSKSVLGLLGGTPNLKMMTEKPIIESQNYIKHLVTLQRPDMLRHIPLEAKSLVNNLLSLEPKKRADHDRLLIGSFFQDPLSKVGDFVNLFYSKTEKQQKEFLCLIGKSLLRNSKEM